MGSCLILLGLSAAFDTIDHSALLGQLSWDLEASFQVVLVFYVADRLQKRDTMKRLFSSMKYRLRDATGMYSVPMLECIVCL